MIGMGGTELNGREYSVFKQRFQKCLRNNFETSQAISNDFKLFETLGDVSALSDGFNVCSNGFRPISKCVRGDSERYSNDSDLFPRFV